MGIQSYPVLCSHVAVHILLLVHDVGIQSYPVLCSHVAVHILLLVHDVDILIATIQHTAIVPGGWHIPILSYSTVLLASSVAGSLVVDVYSPPPVQHFASSLIVWTAWAPPHSSGCREVLCSAVILLESRGPGRQSLKQVNLDGGVGRPVNLPGCVEWPVSLPGWMEWPVILATRQHKRLIMVPYLLDLSELYTDISHMYADMNHTCVIALT